MLSTPVFPSALISVAYPAQESQPIDIPVLGDMVKDRYFPPQIIPSPDGGSSLVMTSEHGHSNILVSPHEATLNVNFSNEWLNDPNLGKQYIVDRLDLFFRVLKQIMPHTPLIYGSAVVIARINSDNNESLAPLVANVSGLDFPADARDVLIRQTFDSSDQTYQTLTTQTLRNWDHKIVSTPYVRLPDSASDSSSIEIVVEVNSRRAHNESIPNTVNPSHISSLLDQSQAVLLDSCQRYQGAK